MHYSSSYVLGAYNVPSSKLDTSDSPANETEEPKFVSPGKENRQ
jgi:hypothetical protein